MTNLKLIKILSLAIFTFLLTNPLQADVFYSEASYDAITNNGKISGANAVSLSGEWMALGAYDGLPEHQNKTCFVSMYKLNYTTMTWTFSDMLGSANGTCNGNKGFGLAISLSGTRMAISTSEGYGKVNLYDYDAVNDEWVSILVIDNPETTYTGFAETLSIQGDYLAIGAPFYDDGAKTDAGRVYIYPWNSINGAEFLTGSQSNEYFGKAVTTEDIGGLTNILIGAPGYDVNPLIDTNEGVAVDYTYDGVTAPIGVRAFVGYQAGAEIGGQVSLGDTTALISGNTGHSFVENSVGVWERDTLFTNQDKGDVSLSNNISAVGYLGRNIHLYPELDVQGSLPYYVRVGPDIPVDHETAEDISFYKDQLLVKHGTSLPALMYDFPCGTGTVLTENTWKMIGIPCTIQGGVTVEEAFNTLNTNPEAGHEPNLGTYGTNWWVYEQNSTYGATSASYIELAADSIVTQGKGYWIYADSNVTTRVDRIISTTRTAIGVGLASDDVAGHVVVSLPDGDATGEGFVKVLVSNEFPRTFSWGNVLLADSSGITTPGTPAGQAIIQDGTAYVYDDESNTGQPYRLISYTPGFGDIIEPGQGFWVKVLAPSTGVSIALPFEK